MNQNIEKLYKILRFVIYSIPVMVIAAGLYIILFPSETYNFNSQQPNASKFVVQKDPTSNEIYFGVFPLISHRYIDLNVRLKEIAKNKCQTTTPKVTVQKTYQAFLFPEGDPVTSEEKLKEYLYANNTSSLPNGSLLHLKPTDQVFLLSKGQKILFPGPEIFRAFGYSFDNLTDVDQATLDQFPDNENKNFLWTMSHPDDTIFEAYPSHKIYLIADGQKHEIISGDILNNVWPNNFTIGVNDLGAENIETCNLPALQNSQLTINCRFDNQLFSGTFGGYYQFTLEYPSDCTVSNIHVDTVTIDVIPEKTLPTVKNSLQNVFASVLNRYLSKNR